MAVVVASGSIYKRQKAKEEAKKPPTEATKNGVNTVANGKYQSSSIYTYTFYCIAYLYKTYTCNLPLVVYACLTVKW